MYNDVKVEQEKKTKASKPHEKENPPALGDIDDLIFGDERTVPSNR